MRAASSPWVALPLLLLLSPVHGSSDDQQASTNCEARGGASDPAGDPAPYPLSDPIGPEFPAVDLLAVNASLFTETLRMELTLAEAPPRGDPLETYRYWIIIMVRDPGGQDFDVSLRVFASQTYEDAALIGPGELGSPYMGTVPAVWANSTVAFDAPLAAIEEYLGPDLSYGSPQAQSDGPHRAGGLVQGMAFAAPYYVDRLDALGPFELLQPCSLEVPVSGAAAASEDGPITVGIGTVGVIAGAFGAAGVALGSWRRQ